MGAFRRRPTCQSTSGTYVGLHRLPGEQLLLATLEKLQMVNVIRIYGTQTHMYCIRPVNNYCAYVHVAVIIDRSSLIQFCMKCVSYCVLHALYA